jgi:signal transduction histidine kinase
MRRRPIGDRDDRELESLARRRLPLAIAPLLAFLAGALTVELFIGGVSSGVPAGRALAVLGIAAGLSHLAFRLAARHRERSRWIAAAWGASVALLLPACGLLAEGDPALAMTVLVGLVTTLPILLPFEARHQMVVGLAALSGLIVLVSSGEPSSLPLPSLCVALGSVVLGSVVAASSMSRLRREASARARGLRDVRGELAEVHSALARAEDAVRVRSHLVANVSHEVRTPVHVILGYADMLLDPSTDAATARHLVGRVHEKAMQLEELIAQLLDLSRLSCGRVERRVGDIDVPGLLEDAAEGVRRHVGRRPIRVRTECRVAHLRSDPGRVRQILVNLATNAAKFTARGEIRLSAWSTGQGVAIEVRDSGCGIPTEKHETVFAAFAQLSPDAGKSESAGIGLGLAIVKQLCDLLEGDVELASTPGQGATFTIRLPHLGAQPHASPTILPAPPSDLEERVSA